MQTWAFPRGTPLRTLGIQLAAAKEVGLLQRPAVQLAGRQVQGAAVDGLQLAQAPAGARRSVQSSVYDEAVCDFWPHEGQSAI